MERSILTKFRTVMRLGPTDSRQPIKFRDFKNPRWRRFAVLDILQVKPCLPTTV